jgi:hypothetical protein
MTSNKKTIIEAARADSIPEGSSGLWIVKKLTYPQNQWTKHREKVVVLPAETYTHLIRITTEKMHLSIPGDIVMEDTPFELKTHLNFMMKAYGKVLVTGLGLGCVVRGLLVNPNVEHITCIEKSASVLNLIAPYMPKKRLNIIQADALVWCKLSTDKFDCAWHDLWTCREDGEPHLQNWHMKLLFDCRKKIGFQGAWNFPRWLSRRMAINF